MRAEHVPTEVAGGQADAGGMGHADVSGHAAAARADDKEAKEVLEKAIKAHGGEKALAKAGLARRI